MPDRTGMVPTNNQKYEIAASEPGALSRVLRRVKYEDDCWVWQGFKSSSGYACMTVAKQAVYVHRLTYWIVRGPVEDGFVLDHLCRNRSCVNPVHTEVVTTRVNSLRGIGNGSQSHCPSGHPYDDSNTRTYYDAKGYRRRYCLSCRDLRNAARKARRASRRVPAAGLSV